MLFVIGILVGISLATFLLTGIVYLRVPIEKRIRQTERNIAKNAPRQKGFIVEAEDEAAQARNSIIEKNKEQGKDTPLTALYENT